MYKTDNKAILYLVFFSSCKPYIYALTKKVNFTIKWLEWHRIISQKTGNMFFPPYILYQPWDMTSRESEIVIYIKTRCYNTMLYWRISQWLSLPVYSLDPDVNTFQHDSNHSNSSKQSIQATECYTAVNNIFNILLSFWSIIYYQHYLCYAFCIFRVRNIAEYNVIIFRTYMFSCEKYMLKLTYNHL
jgi:hypothetical protein